MIPLPKLTMTMLRKMEIGDVVIVHRNPATAKQAFSYSCKLFQRIVVRSSCLIDPVLCVLTPVLIIKRVA